MRLISHFVAPVAFRRVALETPEWTSRDSNHHRQSVSAGKTNAIPTEPSGRPNAIDFPVGKHMTMLDLLLELCGTGGSSWSCATA